MKIIEIANGKKPIELVSGLIWHPLQAEGTAQAKEILAFAKTGGADLKVMREGETPHVGFAKKENGIQPGQISIAALIADALAKEGHKSYLIALSLPADRDTYIFISVRDSVILADGDQSGTQDEIRVRLVSDVSYGGWDAVICPDEWGVLDGKERDLESFLSAKTLKSRSQWQLKEINIAWRKAMLPVIILSVLAVAGSYGWIEWQKKKVLAAQLLQQQQEEVERGQRVAPTEKLKPWPLVPGAVDFVQACTQAWQQANLTAGNWTLDSTNCANGKLTIKWKKANQSAWISHIKMTRPEAVITDDGMSATVTNAAQAEPANDLTTELPAAGAVTQRYQELASMYGLVIRIEQAKTDAEPTALPGQTTNVPTETTSWTALPISIEANIDPSQIIEAIDQAGLRISRLDYITKAGQTQYKLTGVQYVHN